MPAWLYKYNIGDGTSKAPLYPLKNSHFGFVLGSWGFVCNHPGFPQGDQLSLVFSLAHHYRSVSSVAPAMATTVKLLALVAAGASAFSSCAIPSFSWMMLDGGAGSSMAYALATVGSNIYMGGHTTGTFSLTGTGTSGTTVEFVDADGTTDVYVAQVNTAGQPVAINSIASGSTSGGSRFGLIMDIQGLGSSHLVVTGYWKSGNLTFNNGQILQNPRSVSNSFVAKVVAATVRSRCSRHQSRPGSVLVRTRPLAPWRGRPGLALTRACARRIPPPYAGLRRLGHPRRQRARGQDQRH